MQIALDSHESTLREREEETRVEQVKRDVGDVVSRRVLTVEQEVRTVRERHERAEVRLRNARFVFNGIGEENLLSFIWVGLHRYTVGAGAKRAELIPAHHLRNHTPAECIYDLILRGQLWTSPSSCPLFGSSFA